MFHHHLLKNPNTIQHKHVAFTELKTGETIIFDLKPFTKTYFSVRKVLICCPKRKKIPSCSDVNNRACACIKNTIGEEKEHDFCTTTNKILLSVIANILNVSYVSEIADLGTDKSTSISIVCCSILYCEDVSDLRKERFLFLLP